MSFKIILKKSVALSILLPAFYCLHAQDFLTVQRLKFILLNADNGLSQGCVNAIAQDKRGFIWFGTKDGLNKYDGYQFKVYRNNKSDSNSIADNHIVAIVTDIRGLLWIKYFNNKVDVFNPATEKAYHFTDDLKKAKALLNTDLFSFIPVPGGDVYFEDRSGYLKITVTPKSKNSNAEYDFKITSLSGFLPVVNGQTSYVRAFISSSRKLYLSYRDTIVVCSDADISKATEIKRYHYTHFAQVHPPENTYTKSGQRLQFNEVCGEDTVNNRLFIAGVNCFTLYDERSQIKTDSVVIGRYYQRAIINENAVTFDHNGRVWLCAKPSLLYDPAVKTLRKVLAKDVNIQKDVLVGCVFFHDKSGVVFIGTNGYGILKYNSNIERFQHVPGKENETLSLNGIYTDNDENYLWLKKNNQLLIRYNRNTGMLEDIFPSTFPLTGNDGILSVDSKILAGSFFADESGYWILSTEVNSLFHLDKNLRFVNKIFLSNSYKYQDGIITAAGSGRIWLAAGNMTDHVLYLIDTEHDKVLKSFPIPFGKSDISYPFNSSMVTDENNNPWIGTVEGLFFFNAQKETWRHFKHHDKDSTSLPVNTIFSLCNDPVSRNILWIGTNNGGLVKFEKNNGKCTTYTTESGIPNNVIYGILSDRSKNVWVSTNNGIARFDPVTKEVRHFTEPDGLQGNEFNRYAFCQLKSGEMAFGGIHGFNIINPDQINSNRFYPKVLFTGFKIGNKEVTMQTGNTVLSQPIFESKELKLNYTQNFITFSFTTTDYTAKEKNLYQYMLTGLDEDWQPVTKLNEATYTNLDPGNYTFKVRATNSDGVWSKNEAVIKIYISPPWWATWWFRLICIFAFAWALYTFYRYRLKQALKLQSIRNNIASDLHDEIGSTLSSISISSAVIQKKMKADSPEVNSLLSQISSNTDNMMEAMSDIVWAVNTKNDKFENVVNRMRAFAIEILEPEDILLNMNVSRQLDHMVLNMQQRKNLYLLFKEAINNIAKYAACKNVWVDIDMHSGKILMKIRDDGKGFSPPVSENGQSSILGGNGLKNMHTRAKGLKGKIQIDSAMGQGTEIILEFPA